MNTSNITELGLPSELGPTNIVAVIFVALLMLATLFGNFLVFASFYTFHDLRTICNYFIISLSASDIMVALLAMPFWLVLQLAPDMKYQTLLGRTEMSFWNCIDILCGTASIMNLAAVSADRHLAITAPYSYHELMTPVRAILVICGVWLYAITVSCLRLVSIPNKGYSYLVFITSFFLPLASMLIMYTRIYVVALRQARRINRHHNYKTDIKAAKTIAVVIGAFSICWLPFFVLIIGFAVRDDFITHKSYQVYRAIKWTHYLNSCLNPIIYCCLNRTYRRAFKRLFARWKAGLFRCVQCGVKEDVMRSSKATSAERSMLTTALPSSVETASECKDNNNTNGHNGTGNGQLDQTRV